MKKIKILFRNGQTVKKDVEDIIILNNDGGQRFYIKPIEGEEIYINPMSVDFIEAKEV